MNSGIILDGIKKLKRQLLPNERVVLFGSRARGDAREDSDWDLLILLDKDKRDFNADYDKYAYPFAEMGMEYETLINAKVFTVRDWKKQKPSLFYKNVEAEGIEIK